MAEISGIRAQSRAAVAGIVLREVDDGAGPPPAREGDKFNGRASGGPGEPKSFWKTMSRLRSLLPGRRPAPPPAPAEPPLPPIDYASLKETVLKNPEGLSTNEELQAIAVVSDPLTRATATHGILQDDAKVLVARGLDPRIAYTVAALRYMVDLRDLANVAQPAPPPNAVETALAAPVAPSRPPGPPAAIETALAAPVAPSSPPGAVSADQLTQMARQAQVQQQEMQCLQEEVLQLVVQGGREANQALAVFAAQIVKYRLPLMPESDFRLLGHVLATQTQFRMVCEGGVRPPPVTATPTGALFIENE